MANDSYRIAVASSDGIVVNSHFGRAGKFYIYQIDEEENLNFIEERKVVPVCEGGTHDDERLDENLNRLKDCDFILVSKIGEGAAFAASKKGIESYEIPGVIEESTLQLLKYIKLKKLFE
ncbi:MAG: dinitrogenase iron-molybdenum cofactor biosynthesis protein [Lachnospiraceae bacterium]|nr:dinitrogenase iron-molybdenum cofactor biosynthesis protein [Lachnospiraceae bacterium]